MGHGVGTTIDRRDTVKGRRKEDKHKIRNLFIAGSALLIVGPLSLYPMSSVYKKIKQEKELNDAAIILKHHGLEKAGYWLTNDPYELTLTEKRWINNVWEKFGIDPGQIYNMIIKYQFEWERNQAFEEAMETLSLDSPMLKAMLYLENVRLDPVLKSIKKKINERYQKDEKRIKATNGNLLTERTLNNKL